MLANGQPGRSANPLKRPRQDPVSCQFCRSKKLKCDRQQPCSNCLTRGLPCAGQAQKALHQPDAENASILARLKRLEDIVIGGSKPDFVADGNTTAHLPESKTTSPLTWLSPSSEYDDVFQSLEGTGTRDDSWISPSLRGLEFQISTTHQIAATHGISQNLPDKLPHCQPAPRCYSLPPKEEAIIFLDYYGKHIDNLQHVLYVPTVRQIMESVYLNLEHGLPVVSSHVALLLSIFASSAMLCSSFLQDTAPPFSELDGSQASLFWANAALEVLDFSRRTTAGRIEDVQAAILMAFLLYHIEGFTSRSRTLWAAAIATARDLSLHKIDAQSNSAELHDQLNWIETEIKRRVWWYVAATDW